MPRVSVVISTCNRAKRLRLAIESILANNYPDFDLVIVDQSDNNLTRDLVEGYMENNGKVKYVPCSRKGSGRGRNVGIKKAKGAIIATTDDDCEVAQDWVEKTALFFDTHPDAAIVFGDVVPGESTPSGVLCPWYNTPDWKYAGVFSMVGIVGLGANMSIKKETTDKFGLFDEQMGVGASIPAAEDWDLTYRALAAGYTVYGTNSVKVWHNGWRDLQETITTMRAYRQGDAAFFTKLAICGDLRALILLAVTTFETTIFTFIIGLTRPPGRQPIKLPESFLKKCYFLIFWFCHPLVDTIWGIFQAFQFSIDRKKKVFIKKK